MFDNMRQEYIKILNVLYPSKGNTGFTERNLSVNFCNAYKQVFSNAVVWYEFTFDKGNTLMLLL